MSHFHQLLNIKRNLLNFHKINSEWMNRLHAFVKKLIRQLIKNSLILKSYVHWYFNKKPIKNNQLVIIIG